MNTEHTNGPLAGTKTEAGEEMRNRGTAPEPVDEGLGVFRGLLIMFLSYVAFGVLAWYVWQAVSQWIHH